jgi:acyl carrier protein
VEEKVVAVIMEALAQPKEAVTLQASLIDDLGAESIDFLDIAFRLESVFDLQIPDDEIWLGAVGKKDASPDEIDAAIRDLKEKNPEFRWDRFPERPTRADLPRLITIRTVVDYLEGKLREA